MIWLPRTTDNSTYFAQCLKIRGIESRLYMIYDLLIVLSSIFMTAPSEMVAFITSQIYLMIYLIDITNIDKICYD